MAVIPFNFPDELAQAPTVIPGTKYLNGRLYRFRFWPSARANDGKGAWYVDLWTATAEPVIAPVKLILTTDLLGHLRTTAIDIPPGEIVVRRTDGVDADPRPWLKSDGDNQVASLGSPLLVVEYVEADVS